MALTSVGFFNVLLNPKVLAAFTVGSDKSFHWSATTPVKDLYLLFLVSLGI